MAGFLTANMVIGTSSSAPLAGGGTLTAAQYVRLLQLAALAGTGTLDVIARAQYGQLAALAGSGALSSVMNQIYPNLTAALAGSGTLSATAVRGFNPINEENTSRTNQAIPVGTTGCWVTLIGGGGAGGQGYSGNTNGS